MKEFYLICILFSAPQLRAQQNLNTQLNQLLHESISKDAFSGNILIAHRSKIIFQKSAGYANWEKRTPLNDSTLFNIGSLGIDFTRVVIAELITEGTLQLDDPITNYLDLLPDSAAKKITLRMLLQHCSDALIFPEVDFKNRQDGTEFSKQQRSAFEPGTTEQYAASGYKILEALIQTITQKSYEENVQHRIFDRVGMSNSRFISPGMNMRNGASPTIIHPNGEKENQYDADDDFTVAGSGGEYASIKDIFKFYSSVMNDNRLLSEEGKKNFFSQCPDEPIHVSHINSGYSFSGISRGWNSAVDIDMDSDYIIVSLCNFDGYTAEDINYRALQIIHGEKYETPLIPSVLFCFDQWQKLGSAKFVEQINDLLKVNGYGSIRTPYLLDEIGQELYNENNFSDAATILKRNIQLFPADAIAYQWLGMSYVKTGEINEAYKVLKKCLDLDSRNKRAQEILDNME